MNIFKRLFGKKEKNKPKVISGYGNYVSSGDYLGNANQNNLLSPLNPLSPLWYGHANQSSENYHERIDNGGSWDNGHNSSIDSSSHSNHSSDSGSSYDSGSSSSSSDSSSYDSGSSSFDSSSSF
jgi:hypothetical protein